MAKKKDETKDSKWDGVFDIDWSRLTAQDHKAAMLAEKIKNDALKQLEVWATEANECAIAFMLALIRGEAGREQACNQTGDPAPEIAAFELGLMCRPILETWVQGLILGAIPGMLGKK
jgi:hypothetical protein